MSRNKKVFITTATNTEKYVEKFTCVFDHPYSPNFLNESVFKEKIQMKGGLIYECSLPR